MRTTIDIPDEKYKNLKRMAVEREVTVRKLMMDALDLLEKQPPVVRPKKRIELPLIHSERPAAINLTNDEIYDILDADLIESALRFARR
jgi:hypothetical protein